MALTYSVAPAPPSAINLGEYPGTKPITSNFNGAVQSSKLVYIGGKTRIANVPRAQATVVGLIVDLSQDYKVQAMPDIYKLRRGSAPAFRELTLQIGDKMYKNAVWTGGAIQTQDVGEGFKIMRLSKIYTIFGKLVTSST
jgi:hypothetical protein